MRRSRYTKDLLVCLFRCWSDRPSTRWVRWAAALAFAAFAWPTNIALADEGGVSFWLPGIYGSLAAAPQQPGWSFAGVNYFDSVSASGSIAAAREVTVGRFNPARQRQPQCQCKRQSGLGTTRSELCVRDAGFRRSTRGGRDGDRGPQHDGIERYDNRRGWPIHSDEVGQHQRYHYQLRGFVPASVAALEQRG